MKIINFSESRHFAIRAELGVNYTAARQRVGLELDNLIQQLIPKTLPVLDAPDLAPWPDTWNKFIETPQKDRGPIRKEFRQQSDALKRWWLRQLHHTSYPLLERMTLFWHNHFTSSVQTVKWPQLMYRQNQLLRSHALGNFADLLRAIFKDPAMLIYLDAEKNVAESPNENFARELLELFTLGVGHYTENDIVEAARALTGWHYRRASDEVVFRQKRHDDGEKTFLGKTGNFNADDIIQIILDQPRTAEFIAEKFWNHFINPDTPDSETIKTWAMAFRDSGYDITTLLKQVFNSSAFWNESNRGALVKSPVEFTVGLLREFQMDAFSNYEQLAMLNKKLGQEIFSPPDVKGWRGGNAWIDSNSLIQRYEVIDKMADDILERMHADTPFSKLDTQSLAEWLLPLPPAGKGVSTDDEPLLALLKDPVYQLR